MKPLLLFCFVTLSFFNASAENFLLEGDLYELLPKGKIKIVAEGMGGYNGEAIALRVKNTGPEPLKIRISPGTIFTSHDDWKQNLMVTRTEIIALAPAGENVINLRTVCIESSDASPSRGSKFTLSEKATGPLLAMAETIDTYKYFNSTAQSAVWAVANGRGLRYVYGEDRAMMERFCAVISEATGKPCTDENYRTRHHEIHSINTSFEVLLPDYVQGADVKLYRPDGELFKTYLEATPFKPGFYQFKLGVFHTFADTTSFSLRFEDNGKMLFEKQITAADTIVQLQPIPETTFVTFKVDRPVTARVGVYDENDHLYILLADKQAIRPGMVKMQVLDGRELPAGKQYFLKVKEGDRAIVEQPFYADVATGELFPTRTKRGLAKFRLKDRLANADMVIVDESGRVIWSVFEDGFMERGNKQVPFVFQHQQGPNARFFWQLLNRHGEVVMQEEIK